MFYQLETIPWNCLFQVSIFGAHNYRQDKDQIQLSSSSVWFNLQTFTFDRLCNYVRAAQIFDGQKYRLPNGITKRPLFSVTSHSNIYIDTFEKYIRIHQSTTHTSFTNKNTNISERIVESSLRTSEGHFEVMAVTYIFTTTCGLIGQMPAMKHDIHDDAD